MESSSLKERLAELPELAGRQVSEAEFFRELLAPAADDVAVNGALVWRRAADGSFERVASVGVPPSDAADREQLLAESLDSRERRILLNGSAEHPSAQAARTLHWPVGGRLIEIELVPDSQHDERQREWLRYLEAAEPHIAGYLNGTTTSRPDLQDSNSSPIAEQEFAGAVHRTLNLTRLGYTIAHEGRRCIGCDRVGVLVRDGVELRVLSLSGVERVDRRSTTARSMESVARAVLLTGTGLTYQEGCEYSPQMEALLSEYVDASQVRTALFQPLAAGEEHSDEKPCGVLVAEWFERVDAARYDERVRSVARHSGVAVSNALQYAEVAWARAVLPVQWGRALWRTGRRRWTISAAVLLTIAVAALALLPANLVVLARGELQPAERQHVYAAVDGFVEQVLFDDTKPVRQHDPLLRMSNLQLEIDLDKVRSDIRFWEQKLASIEVLRLEERTEDSRESDPAQRAAEEADVRQQLANLRGEEKLLEEKAKLLEVTSPLSGRVITWNAVEQLDYRRYVNHSDRLLTVANVDGAWTLDLQIPERDSGHVAQALADSGEPLDVSYILASHPESTFHARLTRLEPGTQWDRQQQTSVGAEATLADGRPSFGRAGTTVLARIHCGRRSLGYVWFHDLYEAVVTRVWY